MPSEVWSIAQLSIRRSIQSRRHRECESHIAGDSSGSCEAGRWSKWCEEMGVTLAPRGANSALESHHVGARHAHTFALMNPLEPRKDERAASVPRGAAHPHCVPIGRYSALMRLHDGKGLVPVWASLGAKAGIASVGPLPRHGLQFGRFSILWPATQVKQPAHTRPWISLPPGAMRQMGACLGPVAVLADRALAFSAGFRSRNRSCPPIPEACGDVGAHTQPCCTRLETSGLPRGRGTFRSSHD